MIQVSRVAPAEELCSLQKETPDPGSSSPSEQMGNKSTGERLRTKEHSEVLSGDMDVSVNPDIHYEPLSGDSDQDPCSDCRNPKVDEDNPCTLRCIRTKKKEDA
ncbi:Protein TASOR 2 [Manis javanica]|nr:Protein TASOR 2 [Manis javanica]